MLNNKQLKYLRKEAHQLKPIFQIGKGGINENMINQLIDALEARELIKVSILQNSLVFPEEAAEILPEETGADLVQVIGSTLILYKPSEKNPTIKLPK